MYELDLLVEFHKDSDRQGPGSESITKLALDLIPIKDNPGLMITDIGCGSGAQTIVLAQNTDSHITAVDLFPEFLDKLNFRSKKLGLEKEIQSLEASMDELPFEPNQFDIIWSEGAIYNIGFENGIKLWRKYLKPGGFISVSEITWTTTSRPQEITDYWNEQYPEIDTASAKIQKLESSGYVPSGYFLLPEYCWLDNYYLPIEERFDSFIAAHPNKMEAKQLVESEKKEIEIYKKYKDYYSYGFYIARKVEV